MPSLLCTLIEKSPLDATGTSTCKGNAPPAAVGAPVARGGNTSMNRTVPELKVVAGARPKITLTFPVTVQSDISAKPHSERTTWQSAKCFESPPRTDLVRKK